MFSMAILDYILEKYSGTIYENILKEIFEECYRELFKIGSPDFEELLKFSENRIKMFIYSCYEAYNSNPSYYLEFIELGTDYRKIEEAFLKEFSKNNL